MNLYCPKCNEPSANVNLSLADPDVFTCQECNEEFTTGDVRDMLDSAAAWTKVLAWAEVCPTREEAVVAAK